MGNPVGQTRTVPIGPSFCALRQNSDRSGYTSSTTTVASLAQLLSRRCRRCVEGANGDRKYFLPLISDSAYSVLYKLDNSEARRAAAEYKESNARRFEEIAKKVRTAKSLNSFGG